MECNRCNKVIVHPDNTNADYVIASDGITSDWVDVLYAKVHNTTTIDMLKAIELDPEAPKIPPDVYDTIELTNLDGLEDILGLHNVYQVKELRPVQKTLIVCPVCHLDNDILIWGVHKK
jgi:hypothetical protein